MSRSMQTSVLSKLQWHAWAEDGHPLNRIAICNQATPANVPQQPTASILPAWQVQALPMSPVTHLIAVSGIDSRFTVWHNALALALRDQNRSCSSSVVNSADFMALMFSKTVNQPLWSQPAEVLMAGDCCCCCCCCARHTYDAASRAVGTIIHCIAA